jgi:hypothetical protein
MVFREFSGFHLLRGSCVNLSPLLSPTMGNCLDFFLYQELVFFGIFFWRSLWFSFVKKELFEPFPLAKFSHQELF